MLERARCHGPAIFSSSVSCPTYGRTRATFLQIYGGYFLLNLTLLLYCLSCRIWHAFGIDYAAVFPDDPRHHLDWRQAAEVRSASHEERPS
jgi:hypothetical protein